MHATPFGALPDPQGLYDPTQERDSCGVALVATLRGTPGRDIVDAGLTALRNLDHRGAVGAEVNSGDGAGILTQVPDAFLRAMVDVELPPAGSYVVGLAFLPTGPGQADAAATSVEAMAADEGLEVLTWRDVPVEASIIGPTALSCMPVFRQVFLADRARQLAGLDLDRKAYRLRKRVEHGLGVYFASLSARTLVYKGMLTTTQLETFFPDIRDERFASELVLVHSRFSTNTFPSWPLAQPFLSLIHISEPTRPTT